MEKFEKQSVPKACKNLEKFLEKNPKDEVYCVGNKVSYLGILFYDEENYFIVIGWEQVKLSLFFNLMCSAN